MWYAVWRNQNNKLCGFITKDEDDEIPMEWDSKEEAETAMVGHMLYDAGYVEFIEI